MLKLVEKDFKAGYLVLLFIGVTWIMYAMTAFLYNLMVPLAMVFAVGLSLVFPFLDSSFKAEVHIASLPLKRSDIVYARYLSSLIMVSMALIVTVITGKLLEAVLPFPGKGFEIILTFQGIAAFLSVVIMALSYLLPFIFRFGCGKGIGFAFVLITSVVIVITGYKLLIPFIHGETILISSFFQNILTQLQNMTIFSWRRGIQIFLIFISVFIAFISVKLSVKFYSKRDL